MSGGNDHNTSAGDKYSMPVLHEAQHSALGKVKAKTCGKGTGIRNTESGSFGRGNT